jgi:hypothetical protein
MEFRLFLPLVLSPQSSDEEWLTPAISEEYNTRCDQMIRYFLNKTENTSTERRSDSYYIGGDSVGVKLRVTLRRERSIDLSHSCFLSLLRLGKRWKSS